MKPHKETWTSDGERVELCADEPPFGSVVVKMVARFTCYAPEDCTEGERARLAAQAPSMARLLLELAGCETAPYCAKCGALVGLMEHEDADARLRAVRNHMPDCSLVAVLRSAGVVT